MKITMEMSKGAYEVAKKVYSGELTGLQSIVDEMRKF